MPELAEQVRHDLDASVTVLVFTGVLGLSAVPRVRKTLSNAVAQCPSAVIVDLRSVRLPSVVALTVFAAGPRSRVTHPEVAVLLCAPSSISKRAHIASGRPVFDSVAAAIATVAETRRRMSRYGVTLPSMPEAPARARECVDHACIQWSVEHVLNEARLVVSELVTNAVRHAGSGVDLELMLRDPFLHVRVRDGSSAPPVLLSENASTNVGGRGLWLVDLYASGWGYLRGAGGKVVWATLRVRPVAA